jgi:hypothetical protein
MTAVLFRKSGKRGGNGEGGAEAQQIPDIGDMDLSNPWALLSGIVIGMVGFVVFNYGRKNANLKCLATGGILCIFPYFVASALVQWLITAGCLGGLYMWNRGD